MLKRYGSFVALIVMVGASTIGTLYCTSSSPTPDYVACTSSKLPSDGDLCDTSAYNAQAYCRLSSCSSGIEAECRCVDGKWSCSPSARDNTGCGTPPLCREQPCP
jgi:hypothetical protein